MPADGRGVVSNLSAIAEASLVSAMTAGTIAGVVCADAVVFEFSVGFFSADFARCAPAPSSGCGVTGGAALALCKLLAKLLVPCPADGKGRADLADEPDNAASL